MYQVEDFLRSVSLSSQAHACVPPPRAPPNLPSYQSSFTLTLSRYTSCNYETFIQIKRVGSRKPGDSHNLVGHAGSESTCMLNSTHGSP